jgi:protein-S-isoprenylcysteine O-methyltransferase Ste14
LDDHRDAMPTDQAELTDRPSRIPWPPILLGGGVIAAIALGYLAPVTWPGTDDLAARTIGLTIGAAGVALLVWGITTLRRHGTTVLPDVGATTLVTDGPYWRYRNPIYLADAMILLGLAELTKNVWFVAATAAFAALVTWLAILPEERHLERRFGKAYTDYKAKSRRWI